MAFPTFSCYVFTATFRIPEFGKKESPKGGSGSQHPSYGEIPGFNS
jgi:hypothetical protein